MPNATLSIVDEVEAAITTGSPEKRLDTIKRVTDLFLASAGSFDSEQIELFGNVLERLIKTIEIRAIADISARIALAEMSVQLAPVAQAPSAVVRRLAGNDEITIAGPVLTESARLSEQDLVEIAETKGEQHLLAISARWWLKEVVTDALLARRYPSVSRRVVGNPILNSPSKPESGSIYLRSYAVNYCATPPKRSDPGCCHARHRICSRKSEVRLQRSQRG
jgi:uncharacterized protein (DUF2336 family)